MHIVYNNLQKEYLTQKSYVNILGIYVAQLYNRTLFLNRTPV